MKMVTNLGPAWMSFFSFKGSGLVKSDFKISSGFSDIFSNYFRNGVCIIKYLFS